jgi:hypothetical protein
MENRRAWLAIVGAGICSPAVMAQTEGNASLSAREAPIPSLTSEHGPATFARHRAMDRSTLPGPAPSGAGPGVESLILGGYINEILESIESPAPPF